MDALCKFCLKFQYDIESLRFKCKVDGEGRMAKNPCSFKNEFEPHPMSIRDFEKEVKDAREGKIRVHEEVQKVEPDIRGEEQDTDKEEISKETGDSAGITTPKVDKKKKQTKKKKPVKLAVAPEKKQPAKKKPVKKKPKKKKKRKKK